MFVHAFLFFATSMCVFGSAHGTFLDFLQHLPEKIAEAFAATTEMLKSTYSSSLIGPTHNRRVRRMRELSTAEPKMRSLDWPTEKPKVVNIPVLRTLKPPYAFLVKEIPLSYTPENTALRIIEEIPPSRSMLEPSTISKKKKRNDYISQSHSYKYQEPKKFNVKITYKWEIDLF